MKHLRASGLTGVLGAWLLLTSAVALGQPRLVVNTGHTDDVTSVVLSSDRRLALTGSKDQTARIWDVHTGRERLRLSHNDWVTSAAFSPDDRRVVAGTYDARITVHAVRDGVRLLEIDAGGSPLSAVAYTPDGRQIVSADESGDLAFWSATDGRQLARYPLQVGISAMAVSPRGDTLVIGAEGGKLGLVRVADGSIVGAFQGHTGNITAVGYYPDGSGLVSASEDGTARLWNTRDGELVHTLWEGSVDGWRNADWPTAVAFSPDGNLLVVGHQSGYIRVFREAQQVAGGVAHVDARINGLGFSADSLSVFSGAQYGQAVLWEVNTTEPIRSFEGRVDSVQVIDIEPDLGLLAAGSGHLASELSAWLLAEGVNGGRLSGGAEDGAVASLEFAPTGGGLAYTFARSDVLNFISYEDDERQLPAGLGGANAMLAFSPDGEALFVYDEQRGAILGGEGENPQVLATGFAPGELGTGRTDEIILSAAWSPDGRFIATGVQNWALGEDAHDQNYVYLWRSDDGSAIAQYGPVAGGVRSVQFSPDGRYLLASSHGYAWIWEVASGRLLRQLDHGGAVVNTAIWMPDGAHVVTGGRDRAVRVWRLSDSSVVRNFAGHTGQINDLELLGEGAIIASASQDGTIRLWDVRRDAELAQLVSFGGDYDGEIIEWAVIDPMGRFDASNGGEVDGLHWVVNDEVIALAQLKNSYYEPGLLAKLLGYNAEPLRDVTGLAGVEILPEPGIRVEHAPDADDPVLRFVVENRGGGIGPVGVYINGKEAIADARPSRADPQAAEMSIALDLDGHPFFLRAEPNVIEFSTSSADGLLSSRGAGVTITQTVLPGAQTRPDPSIWAVAVGVSNYAGSDIDLTFAHSDAASFAAALRLAARGLVPADRVNVQLLNDDSAPATRTALENAFKDIAARAIAEDILVLYMAGHGVTHGGNDADYYYLLQDAASLEISDPQIRARVAISSEELTALIKQVPARKQVLILDTCAAGQLISDLVRSRGVSSAQMRSIERMKDRTGMYILAGSAADSVSYEATPYGQGLLTYSLLEGMRGAALREEGLVDVGRLFSFALDRVEHLARDLGGVQQPRVSDPRSGSFDIGRLRPEDREKIEVVSRKPIVISSVFQDEVQLRDVLDLGAHVDEALRDAASGRNASFVFFTSRAHASAYALAGRYRVNGPSIEVDAVLSRGKSEADRFRVNGTVDDLGALHREIVEKVVARLR